MTLKPKMIVKIKESSTNGYAGQQGTVLDVRPGCSDALILLNSGSSVWVEYSDCQALMKEVVSDLSQNKTLLFG